MVHTPSEAPNPIVSLREEDARGAEAALEEEFIDEDEDPGMQMGDYGLIGFRAWQGGGGWGVTVEGFRVLCV